MQKKICQPIPAGSLSVFRILFGIIMIWEVYRYFDRGWISRYWSDPIINFKYEGFAWVTPLSAEGMMLLFILMGILSLFITIGLFYRVSTIALLLIFTYTFLLEQARYLNHFYLVILILMILSTVPANRYLSLDSWLWPEFRQPLIPRWPVLLLQFQIGIVYFFGGIAKLNSDWLAGSPLDLWLPRRSDIPFAGDYLALPEVALGASYGALLLDLAAFPLLLYRRTRPWTAAMLLFFHMMNDRLFSIGIFPWFMIAALFLFLPPSWPGEITRYVKNGSTFRNTSFFMTSLAGGIIACWFHEGMCLVPFICGFMAGGILFWDFHINPGGEGEWITSGGQGEYIKSGWPGKQNERGSARYTMIMLGIWCFLQIAIPVRHYMIPGNPSWTEEGHRFSWHMKLRSKSCDANFYTVNPSFGERERIDTEGYLQSWQQRKVNGRPQLIVQFAKKLSAIHNHQPVYADVTCSLNAGDSETLIDPEVNLVNVRFHDWKRNSWIVLQE